MSSKAELEPHKLLWQQDINLIAEVRKLPSTFGRMYCINVVNRLRIIQILVDKNNKSRGRENGHLGCVND